MISVVLREGDVLHFAVTEGGDELWPGEVDPTMVGLRSPVSVTRCERFAGSMTRIPAERVIVRPVSRRVVAGDFEIVEPAGCVWCEDCVADARRERTDRVRREMSSLFVRRVYGGAGLYSAML